MKNGKHTESLDEVLASYERASESFDASVLNDFVQRYPGHADALNRYAQVQLSSVPATQAEIAAVELTDEQMLPLQSKLLERLQQQRATSTSSAADAQEAAAKLQTISGSRAIEAATRAVFGGSDHGQDDLLLLVMEPPGVADPPDWVYSGLATYVNLPMASLHAGLHGRMAAGVQRFSSSGKPTDAQALTWQDAVEQAITDEAVKKAILGKS